jgi:hypothetical protein
VPLGFRFQNKQESPSPRMLMGVGADP